MSVTPTPVYSFRVRRLVPFLQAMERDGYEYAHIKGMLVFQYEPGLTDGSDLIIDGPQLGNQLSS